MKQIFVKLVQKGLYHVKFFKHVFLFLSYYEYDINISAINAKRINTSSQIICVKYNRVKLMSQKGPNCLQISCDSTHKNLSIRSEIASKSQG